VTRSANHADPLAHIATETALSITTTSTVRASVSCTSVCHLDRIDLEHASVIASASPASMVDGAVSCAECHASAKYTPFSAPGVGDWKKNCFECHTPRHDTISAKHDFSVASSATCGPGAGSGCHETARIDRVHYNATTTPDPAVNNNCNVCHKDDGKPLGTLNGGAPANECTDCHGAGGHWDHLATATSDECIACHTKAVGRDVKGPHPTCNTCHNNPSYPGIKAAGRHECVDCHNNALMGDTWTPPDPQHSTGNDSTHTAGSMTTTIGVGSASAACSTCHSAAMKTEHATTSIGAIGCVDCHTNVASVNASAVVASGWAAKTCDECHVTNGPGKHGTYATGHVASSTAGCASSGAGCHPSTDLRTIHSGKAGGCQFSGCHDAVGAIPNKKGCGSGGDCHTNKSAASHTPVTGDDTTHTANAGYMATKVDAAGLLLLDCTGCHINTLRSEHNTVAPVTYGPSISCTECHNNTGSSGAPSSSVSVIKPGPWNDFCSACHTVTRTAGHATSTPGPHAVNDATQSAGAGGAWCTSCHTAFNSNISTAHSEATTIVASVTYNTCNVCHRGSADTSLTTLFAPVGAWDCVDCHPSNRSSHGVSAGGLTCYGCHTTYQSPMEDDSGTKTGATNASYYHHVLGSATSQGDTATAGGTASYPTSTTAVYCISCHTDHNYFNANKGKNLRSDIASSSGNATANTDFIASGSYGICVSCHGAARAKQGMGTEQASLGATNTPSINGTDFALSAHEYPVGSAFGASAFNANCSKCHSDEQEKKWQTSTYRFGTHWSDSVGILRALGTFVGNPPMEEACYKCHNKTGAPYGETLSSAAASTQAEFGLSSKHDLSKVACVNCHNVHEATATAPAADPDNTYNVASLATTASINTFCLKCHDGGLPSQTVTSATLIPYTVTANATANVAAYYATSGHGTTATAGLDCRDCHEQHGSSLRQLLRASVSGTNVPVYSDTSDQAQCLACHRAGGAAAAANIARYFPASAYGTAPADMARSGHRTKNAGTLVANSALPCRICHDPHGGAGSGYMLTVRTQLSAGVATLVGDAPGELAMSDADQTTATAVNVRRFCLSCHTDSVGGSGWNGSANASVAAGCQVLGISRTGGVLRLPALPNGVKGHALADTTMSCYMCHGDDFSAANSVNVHNPASGESRGSIPCYTCHTVYQTKMEDGSGTTSHSVGADRTSSFHHVLGQAGGNDGDNASIHPTSGVAGFTNIFCLSCHIDHDWFSPFVNPAYKRSANLRLSYGSITPSAAADGTNTDFVPVGGTNGVCLGCHSQRLARDNTNQKAETTSSLTPTITAAAYGASAHEYEATSTFTDASTFRGNCVKCHDSEIDGGGMERGSGVAGYQTSTNKFSVHYSAATRILGAMGVVISDPPVEERVCYKCHSRLINGLKPADNLDWYGKASMSSTAQALYSIMTTTYAHKVANYAGLHRPSSEDETRGYITRNKHIECADCHDVHEAQASRHSTGTNLVSGALRGVSGARVTTSASNWTSPTAATGYSLIQTATYEYQICFKCHSGFNQSTVPSGSATLITWGGSGAAAWTDQGLEFSTSNQSYHPVLAALPVTDPGANGSNRLAQSEMRAVFTTGGVQYGGWTIGKTMYCSDCHAQSGAGSFGPHGSGVKWMLRGPNQAWPYLTAAANGTNATTGWRDLSNEDTNINTGNGLFCNNCHTILAAPHNTGNHTSPAIACVGCHIRVPHGGKVSRLLNACGSNTGIGNLPLRYTATGDGNYATYMLNQVTKPAADTWGASNCFDGQGCGDYHTTVGTENW
ncbi:MAG: hypothetical protein C0418_04650, partial [Coriobacteriaceae bacterium]|nr:hypothetical protein [Coriobacteriaceae bacterium]